MTTSTVGVQSVAAIWARQFDLRPEAVAAQIQDAPQVVELAALPPSALRLSARAISMGGGHRRSSEVPLDEWLTAARRVADERAAVQEQEERAIRTRAEEVVTQRAAVALRHPPAGVSAELAEEAFGRLRDRVATGQLEELRLRRRAPRYRRDPWAAASGAPHIDADDVEIAITAILSLTAPKWTFSSTPQGSMFTHVHHGYCADEGERSYVDGLSDVVDTASDVVARHRGGAGGRVYITRRHVECADCGLVIAWIGQDAGARTSAIGTCPSLPARSGRWRR